MKLLSDRIQEFIDWLNENTDFGQWDESVKQEVHKKLIVFMISDETKGMECPYCKGVNTYDIYRPEIFEYKHVCRDCDKGF